MKALIRKALAGAGLVRTVEVEQANAKVRKAADKARRLEAHVAKLRSDADTWKQRHAHAAAAAAESKTAAARAKAHAQSAQAQVEEWKKAADALTRQLGELRDRLDESTRVAAVAREQLMATEVKLDLIEAAIQVLDARTREAALPRS